MSVSVSASPEFPLSASSTMRTVTLTATSTAPSGVSYQWQQGSGSGWTDLGAKTTSLTKDVSFTTRGTRKFRVVASHAVVPSATSSPVYVTWDERAIVGEMIGKLSDAVATSTTYKAAQTALLKCMNGSTGGGGKDSATSTPGGATSTTPTYISFNDILAQYATTTKAKMDGECSATSTAMFSANQSTTQAELAKLKAGNTVYAALLDTPYGRQFEANAGHSPTLKQDATQLASVLALDDTGSTATGQAPAAGGATHGFESCLPTNTDPSQSEKFDTINCLQFEKPHSLWVQLHGSQVKQTALKRDLDRYEWLQYDNFACSNRLLSIFGVPIVDLPDPGRGLPCMKHDIPYASLQILVADSGTPSETLDIAWNPRNKFLADHLFVVDGICGMKEGKQRRECISEAADDHGVLETLLHVGWWVPKINHFGVSGINNKGWPITEQDAAHAKRNLKYLTCDVPRISNVNITFRSGREFDATWNHIPGCVQDITINSYEFCFDRTYSMLFFSGTDRICRTVRAANMLSTGSFTVPIGTSSVTLVSVALRPNDNTNERLYYPKILFESQAPVSRD